MASEGYGLHKTLLNLNLNSTILFSKINSYHIHPTYKRLQSYSNTLSQCKKKFKVSQKKLLYFQTRNKSIIQSRCLKRLKHLQTLLNQKPDFLNRNWGCHDEDIYQISYVTQVLHHNVLLRLLHIHLSGHTFKYTVIRMVYSEEIIGTSDSF